MAYDHKAPSTHRTDGILLRRPGGDWSAPEGSGYTKEAELQKILFEHPELLPGVEASAIACREFESGVGPADVLVVTDNGRLFAVECKLAYNPQIRREIIGQLLDYASRLWGMTLEDFEARWQARTGTSPFDGFDDDATELRASVNDALTRGAFTLVLAVDRINPDLKRIVEYLNEITREEVAVIAFEAARVTYEDVEILLPRLYGAELAETKQVKKGGGPPWTRQDFMSSVTREGAEVERVAQEFLDSAEDLGFTIANGTATAPSVILRLDGFPAQPISLYSGSLRVRLRLHDIVTARGSEAAEAFARPLVLIAEAELDGDNLNLHRKITLPTKTLTDPGTRALILRAMATLVEPNREQ